MSAAAAIIPLCRHLKTNGHRCESPALHGGDLCFFHNNLHHAHRRPPVVEALSSGWQESAVEAEGDPEGDPFALARVYPRQDQIQFPPLEDAESIQLATSMLFQAIATGQIYFKRARLLLYTLKIACINQRALTNARAAESNTAAVPTRITRTADGLALAPPDTEPPAAPPVPAPEPSHTSTSPEPTGVAGGFSTREPNPAATSGFSRGPLSPPPADSPTTSTPPPADSLDRTAHSSGRPTPPLTPPPTSEDSPTNPPAQAPTPPTAGPGAPPTPTRAEGALSDSLGRSPRSQPENECGLKARAIPVPPPITATATESRFCA